MAYYNPQVMPPTTVPSARANPQKLPPATDPAQMQPRPGIPPRVAALMPGTPGAGYDNIGVPLSTLHGASGAGPAPGAQPVQPGQMFQNAHAQFSQAPQSKPMQIQPQQASLAQRQAAIVSGIANRPGVSPAVAALMAQHRSQQPGPANDVTPRPRMSPNLMNRMRAFR